MAQLFRQTNTTDAAMKASSHKVAMEVVDTTTTVVVEIRVSPQAARTTLSEEEETVVVVATTIVEVAVVRVDSLTSP